MSRTASKVAIAVLFQVFDFQTVMIVCHLVAPIIPENFHRHALGRIAWQVTQLQSASIGFEQLRDKPRSFGRMNSRSIHNDDHAPFPTSRTCDALFNQATKCFRISFLGADAHDCALTPICCSALMTLGRMDTRGADFALLSTQHPHPRQSRKQTHFRFVLNVDIDTPRRVL